MLVHDDVRARAPCSSQFIRTHPEHAMPGAHRQTRSPEGACSGGGASRLKNSMQHDQRRLILLTYFLDRNEVGFAHVVRRPQRELSPERS